MGNVLSLMKLNSVEELYDIAADRGETWNVIEAYPEEAKEL